MNERRSKLAAALGSYANGFRAIGTLASIGLIIGSIAAGEGCTGTTLGVCVERGWSVNGTVVVLWVSVIGVLMQTFWAALVSDSLAVLLKGEQATLSGSP